VKNPNEKNYPTRKLFNHTINFLSTRNKSKSKKPILPERQEPKLFTFHTDLASNWKADSINNEAYSQILYAVNRTDSAHFAKMDSVVVPDDLTGDLEFYMPFPLYVPYLKDVKKIIYFSYPTQTFATYENGILMRTGPTNMGKKETKTHKGLFYTNWKAESTISTFSDEWELLWNFNIENKEGIGWHQYALPGYPASHACLRLQEKDARYLYTWADQWVMANKHEIKVKGTPVIIFGDYNFDAPKPWISLVQNKNALKISEEEIKKQTTPFLEEILKEQTVKDNSEL